MEEGEEEEEALFNRQSISNEDPPNAQEEEEAVVTRESIGGAGPPTMPVLASAHALVPDSCSFTCSCSCTCFPQFSLRFLVLYL